MKEINPKNITVAARIDRITNYYLDRLCDRLDISISQLIRALIKEKYRDLFGEDEYDD